LIWIQFTDSTKSSQDFDHRLILSDSSEIHRLRSREAIVNRDGVAEVELQWDFGRKGDLRIEALNVGIDGWRVVLYRLNGKLDVLSSKAIRIEMG